MGGLVAFVNFASEMIRDQAHLAAIIDLFRRAALGEVSWEAAMAAVSDATRSTSANLVGAHDGRLQFAWTNNLDPAMWIDLGEAMNSVENEPPPAVRQRGRRLSAFRRAQRDAHKR